MTTLFRHFNLPVIVGYIIVGIFFGPYALAWIANSQVTHDIAEFGIVFLLFTIGLEFSLTRLRSIKKIVFVHGSLEVIFSIIITAVIGMLLGMSVTQVIIVGAIVAMSSTAITLKQLKEQFELDTAQGNAALGILLFQDLAVIPLLILIPSLANTHSFLLLQSLVWAIGKGILVIILILTFGRWVLRPVFFRIADTRSIELFTLTVLFVTLGVAWITHTFGLSLALGAFLAGIMLGETEFRHQIATEVRPFRDVLLGLFFISIGMQLNIALIRDNWPWVIILLAVLIIFKVVLIYLIGILFGHKKETALQTGIILAQGGEFGFVILNLALSYHLLAQDYSQVILCAVLFSMILAPILIRFNKNIAAKIFPRNFKILHQETQQQLATIEDDLSQHAIICGYGRVGQNVARFLDIRELKYIAFDLDPNRVNNARLAGDNVCYADASHPDILNKAGIATASVVLISFNSYQESLKIISIVRQINQQVPIIVRCFDDQFIDSLYQVGATEVIPETFEASLMIASHLLLLMKVASKDVYHLIDESRKDRYTLLRMIYPGEDTLVFEEADLSQGLHVVTLKDNAYAIGKYITDLPLQSLHVQVKVIRRGTVKIRHALNQQQLPKGMLNESGYQSLKSRVFAMLEQQKRNALDQNQLVLLGQLQQQLQYQKQLRVIAYQQMQERQQSNNIQLPL